jgi:hypothetical protein
MVGALIAVAGGIAALVLYSSAHRSCTPPSAAGPKQASSFARDCVNHGVPFLVAVAVLALGAFVIANSVALSLRSTARRRRAPLFDTSGPGQRLDAERDTKQREPDRGARDPLPRGDEGDVPADAPVPKEPRGWGPGPQGVP